MISLGPQDQFYESSENEQAINQKVSIEVKNISDVLIRNCKLEITNINPAIPNTYVPIHLRGGFSIPDKKVERIQIARFAKRKLHPAASQFIICVPIVPSYNGGLITLTESSYDITIEASCDEAVESKVVNYRLWIDERDVLRLAPSAAG